MLAACVTTRNRKNIDIFNVLKNKLIITYLTSLFVYIIYILKRFRNMNSLNSVNSFWNSLNILISKPHTINKRIWGHKVVKRCKCKALNRSNDNLLNNFRIINIEKIEEFFNSLFTALDLKIVNNCEAHIEIVLIELLPKCYNEKHAYQLIYIQKNDNKVTFYDVSPKHIEQNLCPKFSYTFYLSDNIISMNTNNDVGTSDTWLKNIVLPQVIKWAEQDLKTYSKPMCSESLTLISNEKYYEIYNKLKLKYGKALVKIWPESTDPLKFVYEDISIATYLLIHWQRITKESQTFIDLGCGNGLLVYILTMEGHSGIGIDVRKRKIWDMYPNNIILKVHTVTPPNVDIFPEADWIIGNHSDELTPWIPIIAARSSYECNFFLLPCCAYNLDGTKYQRQNSSNSQYTEYLEKIKELCEQSGFETQVDRLKIPSTKRICFLTKRRKYCREEYITYLDMINNIVLKETGLTDDNVNIKNIKTRDAVEKVKNCTQIDRSIVDIIVKYITSYLLSDIDSEAVWTIGKDAKISELIQIIPKEKLIALKSECGGLQTLLKNNHQIFEVKNGNVKIRYPKTINEVKTNIKKSNIKTQVKQCWFYNNHPQGCPLEGATCSFLHVKN